jgi:hypothetical protein
MSKSKETIIYIYSDFSPCCKQVQERVVEISNVLPIVILNIDNKRVRRMVLRCKRIRLTKVPCLLIINNPDHRVELYEGDNFLQAFDTLYNAFIVQPRIEQQQREMIIQQQAAIAAQQQAVQQQAASQHIDTIPQDMQYIPPSGKKATTSKKTPLSSIIETTTQEEAPRPPATKKLGRNKFINDASIMPFSEDGIVAGSGIERPNRGEGHTDMAQSSLPEIGMTQDYTGSKKEVRANQEPISVDNRPPIEPTDEEEEMVYDREIAPPNNNLKSRMSDEAQMATKKVPVKFNGKMEMITDLSEALDEADSLITSKEEINIEEMRGGPPKNDVKTQKMSAAKMAAEQMMKERQSMK